jgi:hypothetical protein
MAKKAAGANPRKGPSKMGLVREALQTMGNGTMPKALAEFIRNKHGVNVDSKQVGVYKSQILKKSREGDQPGPYRQFGPRREPRSPAAVNPAEVILMVKDAARHAGGMEQLKAIIQALEH